MKESEDFAAPEGESVNGKVRVAVSEAVSGTTEYHRTPVARRPWPDKQRRPTLRRFVAAQALNTQLSVVALRPFSPDEFGTGAASPSEAHIQAANQLMANFRERLLKVVEGINQAAALSASQPTAQQLHSLLARKEQALRGIKLIEKIWDYYLELFGQRQTRFADRLLAADRIALDCYQAIYTGLGTARSIPSPPPFSYMETGFTPATFRRGVPLSRLAQSENPFPVTGLPNSRLVTPWTLGAVHHEVSHNIQNDLELWQAVPRRIYQRLRGAGLNPRVAAVWSRWHKEIWADLCGLLLGGPAIVASLIDVLARSPTATKAYNRAGVHPTPYLRTFISLELLRRMEFPAEAEAFYRLWQRLYPSPQRSKIPWLLLETFPQANRLVVDTICFQAYRQLGDKSLAQVVRFTPDYQKMTEEAAQRLAAGTDPGIIPARFLVGAARYALDHNLAPPDQITQNFYQALSKR